MPMLKWIAVELRQHAPFTVFGAATGVAIMIVLSVASVPRSLSSTVFWSLHPVHVLLSALTTTAMYRLKGRGSLRRAIVIGYIGSIGIATLSDSIIPYLGEWILDLPNRQVHLGFIERWWLVNPLAAAGIALGYVRPHTTLPHAGHVLLSTWASLFHMNMAMGGPSNLATLLSVGAFLFVAVWVPCCTSDIVFPLLFVERGCRESPARPRKTITSDYSGFGEGRRTGHESTS
jgi:hypothetical protein